MFLNRRIGQEGLLAQFVRSMSPTRQPVELRPSAGHVSNLDRRSGVAKALPRATKRNVPPWTGDGAFPGNILDNRTVIVPLPAALGDRSKGDLMILGASLITTL
jgi:hypothetical protein